MDIYSNYKCRTCKLEFVLLSDDVDKMSKDRYLVCPYCSSKRLDKGNTTNDLRECMKEKSYKRVHGALRQVRHD